jgi:hypothetical protein
MKDEYDQVIPAKMWDDMKTMLNVAVLFTENIEAHGILLPCAERVIGEMYWEFTKAKKNTGCVCGWACGYVCVRVCVCGFCND